MELLLESGAGAPYPPRGRLQLLPSAQAWKAQPALPSGERQGDLVPEREREETWLVLGAEAGWAAGAGPSGGGRECGAGGPRAGLRYSPASGPALSFRASDRCLTRKSCS